MRKSNLDFSSPEQTLETSLDSSLDFSIGSEMALPKEFSSPEQQALNMKLEHDLSNAKIELDSMKKELENAKASSSQKEEALTKELSNAKIELDSTKKELEVMKKSLPLSSQQLITKVEALKKDLEASKSAAADNLTSVVSGYISIIDGNKKELADMKKELRTAKALNRALEAQALNSLGTASSPEAQKLEEDLRKTKQALEVMRKELERVKGFSSQEVEALKKLLEASRSAAADNLKRSHKREEDLSNVKKALEVMKLESAKTSSSQEVQASSSLSTPFKTRNSQAILSSSPSKQEMEAFAPPGSPPLLAPSKKMPEASKSAAANNSSKSQELKQMRIPEASKSPMRSSLFKLRASKSFSSTGFKESAGIDILDLVQGKWRAGRNDQIIRICDNAVYEKVPYVAAGYRRIGEVVSGPSNCLLRNSPGESKEYRATLSCNGDRCTLTWEDGDVWHAFEVSEQMKAYAGVSYPQQSAQNDGKGKRKSLLERLRGSKYEVQVGAS